MNQLRDLDQKEDVDIWRVYKVSADFRQTYN